MSNNLQKVIDDTVVLYNGVYSKTYKSIVRSRDYKRYLSQLDECEAVVSQTIMQTIATRQPCTRKIKIKRVPNANDIQLLKEYLVA
jgi:hypothetical protein